MLHLRRKVRLLPARLPGKLKVRHGLRSRGSAEQADAGWRQRCRVREPEIFDDILAGRTRLFGEDMAQVCDICGKGPQFGNNISHAHNITKRRWNVNLHPVRAKVGGGAKRLRVCSSCLKAGKVVKA
jgi:large subunit ribosomal protein L28